LLARTALAAPAAHEGLTGDMDCNACHTADSWKLSAGAGGSGFDHDKTGFALRAAHAKTSCVGCHRGPKPPETCDGCHKDPHAGRMDGQCYECHTAVAWSDVQQLEQHRRTRMPLTGKHAIVECAACHKRQSERTYSDLPVDCYACHAKDYHAPTTHPNHDGTGVVGQPFSRDCGMCHRTTGWTPAVAAPSTVMPRVQQAVAHDPYFALSTGSHKALDCGSCHIDQRRPRAVRCDACHDDTALRGQHKTRVSSSPAGCMRCHPRGARR
jgi:hypothetical protein